MKKPSPTLVLAASVVCGSSSSILVRLSAAPSLVTASWRMLWVVALVAPVVLLKNRRELAKVAFKDVLICAGAGVLLALHFFTWFESLKHTSVASATTLVCTSVIFTALGYTLFMGGRIPRAGVAAIAVTFLGGALISGALGGVAGSSLRGNLLAVAGAACVAAYTLIGRLQRRHLSTGVYTFLVYLFCALTFLAMAAATRTPLLGWGWGEVLIGLALAVLCTLLGHSLFNWSLKYLSPAYASAASLGEPVFASALAALLFHEVPSPVQVAGAAVIIGGILLFTWAEARAAKQGAEG